MRLPCNQDGSVNQDEAIKMIRYGIDNGINYLDTAYPYHGGESERVLGKALKDGYREKVKIATKMPLWKVSKAEDLEQLFNEQLDRLQVEKIDYYLWHGLGQQRYKMLNEINGFKWIEEKRAKGKIGEIGFSFHENTDSFIKLIDGYPSWTFCQIQYNYMNETVQAGTKGLEYAAKKGVAVIIMEPLLGGKLANPSAAITDLMKDAGYQYSSAEIALRWLFNKPEISLVLSGMSNMEQLKENLEITGRAEAGGMKESELALINKIKAKHNELRSIPCTDCKYCMPCPSGVDIPHNFRIYNDGMTVGGNFINSNKAQYQNLKEKKAEFCTQCKACEEKCPQSIKISECMKEVAAYYK
jgi:hypothetical protein